MRVKDKVVIVTGGASGIGRASALRLAEQGARLVVADMNESGGTAAAAAIGEGARFMRHDVADEDDWRRVVADTAAVFGRLDVLVSAAGVGGADLPQDPESISLDDWRKINSVNLEGVALGCKHAIPAMRAAGGGSIVNVSSLAAMLGTPLIAAYGAGKAGVRQYTKSVALHCARKGYRIRCNSIHPGVIETPMGETMFAFGGDPEQGRERYRRMIPMRTLGEPDDIAYAVVYLASDESKYVTGAEFVIDGGLSIY